MAVRSKIKSDTTASRIRELRLQKHFTQKELSEMLYKSESTVRMWELGKSEPDLETVNKLSDIFGVSVDYLLGKKNDMFSTETLPGNIRPIKTKKFRMLGEIACGKPIFTNEDHESYIDASADIKADFCLTAKGDSMTGARIYDGDVVFIRSQEMVDNGDIAAVIIDDEATLKRWYYYPEKGKLVLNPENPAYEPLVYVGEELNTIRCLGKAVCFMSNL